MLGYYTRTRTLTARGLHRDGWLRTGDKARWMRRQCLRITRPPSRTLFKTSKGKYVARGADRRTRLCMHPAIAIVHGRRRQRPSRWAGGGLLPTADETRCRAAGADRHKCNAISTTSTARLDPHEQLDLPVPRSRRLVTVDNGFPARPPCKVSATASEEI